MKQTCYVCSGAIQGDPVYIGKDKFRHKRCAPGGVRWVEQQRQKRRRERSEYYAYYLLAEKEQQGGAE